MAHRWWQAALVAAVLVVSSWAAIPGPTDPRYPDEIVYPRVTCDREGVFPHPRNCSWYYRCVDRLNIGYFWTYHFECEPGTVFADELDQCVHPFLTSPPCGTGGGATTFPTTASLPIWPPIIFPPTTASPATRPPPPTLPPTPRPPPPTLPPTTQSPGTNIAPFALLCHFKSEHCSVYEPCPPDTERRTLCTGCYIGNSFIGLGVLCPRPGLLYDRTHRKCILDPARNPNCLNVGTTPPTTTTTTPTTTTTTTTTTPKPTTTTTTPKPTTTTTTTTTTTPKPTTTTTTTPKPTTTTTTTTTPKPTTTTTTTTTPKPTTTTTTTTTTPKPTTTTTTTTTPKPTTTTTTTTTPKPTTTTTTTTTTPKPTTTTTTTTTPKPTTTTTTTTTPKPTTTTTTTTTPKPTTTTTTTTTPRPTTTTTTTTPRPTTTTTTTPKPTTTTTTTTRRPTTTTAPLTVSINQGFSIPCSDNDRRHIVKRVTDLGCKRFVLCSDGNVFKGRKFLCKGYYECRRTFLGGWVVDRRNCFGNTLFSDEEDRCIQRPSQNELC